MSLPAETALIPHSQMEQLREARAIIRHEAECLQRLSTTLDTDFCRAADLFLECRGRVIVTGIGKAGLIGQKICATLSSTGTAAQFLHPVEAVHGDLGSVQTHDVLLALSNSGETEELCRVLPIVRTLGPPIVAITSTDSSTLARAADCVLRLGRVPEAGLHGLAPTASTTAMLAMGDALALVVSHRRGFTRQNFATFHPGGNLGLQLQRTAEVMRPREAIRVAHESTSVRDVFATLSRPGQLRRTGAVILVDDQDLLTGLFTDSDLARLLEGRREHCLDQPISNVMTRRPQTIGPDTLLEDAVELLSRKKLSELPVVDDTGRPVGLIDITDVIGLLPHETGHAC